MKQQEVEEVIACLGNERRVFHYFKDRYCLDLIGHYMDRCGLASTTIAELKASHCKQFLQKPLLKQSIAHCANGELNREDIATLWPARLQAFNVSLVSWGNDRWGCQTTRKRCNLVLQLNFCASDIRRYQSLIKPRDHCGPFETWGHPVSRAQRKTLAWVRMDIDLARDEVLIEEVQSDWLRLADRALAKIEAILQLKPEAVPEDYEMNIGASYSHVRHYVREVLSPFRAIWAEAALLAAINFIKQDLGLRTVYYHTYDTGMQLKNVYGKPPRSLYTQLPKRFGFRYSEDAPQLLCQDPATNKRLRKITKPAWFVLQ